MKKLISWVGSYSLASVCAGLTLWVFIIFSGLSELSRDALEQRDILSFVVILPAVVINVFLNALPFAVLFSAFPEFFGVKPRPALFSIFGAMAAIISIEIMTIEAIVTTPINNWRFIFDGVWLEELIARAPMFVLAGAVGGFVLGWYRKKSVGL